MKVALVLQVVGAACLVGGTAMIAPWLGFIVAGVCALAFGIALERGL